MLELIVRAGAPSVVTATISASDIRNARSGSITTLDTGINTLDLNLFADMDIVNHGNISGNGDLNLIAGGSILNITENASAPLPSITAGKNLNLQSRHIVNAGIISATAGNINMADQFQAGNNLISIYSQGGTFSARNDDIIIGNNNFVESDQILLLGGDYHSSKLILNAGTGSADGIMGDVTGELKVSAGLAHLGGFMDLSTKGTVTATMGLTSEGGTGGTGGDGGAGGAGVVQGAGGDATDGGNGGAGGTISTSNDPGVTPDVVGGLGGAGGTGGTGLPPGTAGLSGTDGPDGTVSTGQ